MCTYVNILLDDHADQPSLTCRRRHKKCDERQPVCGPCSVSSRNCVYADRRNGPAGGAAQEVSAAPGSPPEAQAAEGRPGSSAETTADRPSSLGRGGRARAGASTLPRAHGQTFSLPSGLVEPGLYPASPGARLAQAVQRLDDARNVQYSYSPDTVASQSELLTADLASTRWLDLLATDAAQADKGFSLAPTRHPSPAADTTGGDAYSDPRGAGLQASVAQVQAAPVRAVGGAGAGAGAGPSALAAHEGAVAGAVAVYAWQLDQDIPLRSHEADLFRTFAERAALWLDLFDPCRHFSTHATRLAVGAPQLSFLCRQIPERLRFR